MKTYRKIVLSLAAVMLLTLMLGFAVLRSYRSTKTNTLTINDMLCTVKEQWDDLQALDRFNFSTDYLIFDSSNHLLYASKGTTLSDITSPEKAVSQGCLTAPIHDRNRLLGILVMPDPDKFNYDKAKFRLIAVFCGMCACILILMIVYGISLYLNVILPFQRMQQFADRIAQGILDQPLEMDRCNLFGKFSVSFDIMREELKAAREKETALKQREKELIASLSHDLKTPISGIKLLCELLSVKLKDEYTLQKIAEIDGKASQIDRLVSDLLAASLDDLGEMQVSCLDEPSSVLHELIMLHDPQKLVREETIPACMILIDKSRLSQILGNIISNSYKYAGTPIDIAYSIKDAHLKMSITDHGTGVQPHEINLITNKFYRGESAKAAGKDGSGLGLYIASELMEKMNGALICSYKEKGLTVTLLIPLS